MPDNTDPGHRRWRPWRIAGWTAAALLLLLPLVAMQFTDEVNWTALDFITFGAMLLGVGVPLELAVRSRRNTAYRFAVGIALVAAFLLVWINLAVGIIGSERNEANAMFFGVLGVGLIGAILAGFRPEGMAWAMFAMALAQGLVAVIALNARLGATDPNWPWAIVGLTGFFGALWLTSAWLFRRAARGRPQPDAA